MGEYGTFGVIKGTFILGHRRGKMDFSVSGIVDSAPESPFLAAAVMLLLFAVKSLSIVLYSGILYAASGILFPLLAAVAVNFAGTIVMVTIPYFIGRKLGSRAVKRITAKYPRAAQIREMRRKNDIFVVFLARLVGILPCDIVSLYMGAVNIQYWKYLLGCILGFLPSMVTFPVMGMNIKNPRSPTFLIALAIELLFMIASLFVHYFFRKRRGR